MVFRADGTPCRKDRRPPDPSPSWCTVIVHRMRDDSWGAGAGVEIRAASHRVQLLPCAQPEGGTSRRARCQPTMAS
jgi:hypothetical protein